jgi:glycerol-3-phosphate acyltransferase PlsX
VARELTVSIDAMGGDAGPGVVVSALARCVQRHPLAKFILHGDEAKMKPLFVRRAKLLDRVSIRHAPDRISMEERPSIAVRRGRNSSMWRAIESVKNKEAEVVLSAGNTGALMAMGRFHLGMLDGISRPAISVILPTRRGQVIMLDAGANVESDAEQLVDFAVMGEAFARALLNIERPSVGLLNVGSEDVKGNEAVKGAAHILRNVNLPMEFAGFVEGDDIAEGTTDVVVTDGFAGNIALKTAEGTARLITTYLRGALRRTLFARMGAVLANGALNALRRKIDPRAFGGGVFLGLNGVVVKAHGGTDALGFASALDMAIDMTEAGIINRIMSDHATVAAALTTGAAAS